MNRNGSPGRRCKYRTCFRIVVRGGNWCRAHSGPKCLPHQLLWENVYRQDAGRNLSGVLFRTCPHGCREDDAA